MVMMLGGPSVQTAKIAIGCVIGFILIATSITFLSKWDIPSENQVKVEKTVIDTIIQPCPVVDPAPVPAPVPAPAPAPANPPKRAVSIEIRGSYIDCRDEVGDTCQFKSQAEEDKQLMTKYFTDQASQKRGQGVIVEIGGNDGITYSNSYFFERYLGWKSVLIEASRDAFPKLLVNRPNAIKLNMAACKEWGKVQFLENPYDTAVSGIEDHFHDGLKNVFHPKGGHSVTYDVECGPLSDMFKIVGVDKIDIFSIDVEGGEYLVLESVDWNAISVHYVLIELDGGNPEKDEKCRQYLIGKGFESIGKIGTFTKNEFFVNKKFQQ